MKYSYQEHIPRVYCSAFSTVCVCVCHNIIANTLWLNDPYMYLHLVFWKGAIKTACAVLGVVNRHGRSYSMVSSIHHWRKKGRGGCSPPPISREGPHPQYAYNVYPVVAYPAFIMGHFWVQSFITKGHIFELRMHQNWSQISKKIPWGGGGGECP